MFDSIINDVQEKLGLGDKAGGVVVALLGLIANPAGGGFGGFLNKFRRAGMNDEVDSWIGTGENTSISNDQVESALGAEAIETVAGQSGVDRTMAASAIGFLTPRIVDALTPDGVVPDEAGLFSKITGFLSSDGGAAATAVLGGLTAAGAFASGAAGKVGDAAGATFDAGKGALDKGAGLVGDAAGATVDAGKGALGKGANMVSGAAGAVSGKVGDAMSGVGGAFDDNRSGGGILRWVLPLILLGLLVGIAWWILRPSTPIASTNANVNRANAPASNTATVAKTVDSSFQIEAKDGKYIVSGVVPDQKTFDEIKAKLDAQFGAGNVDYAGLKVNAAAKPFAAGWWDNFAKMLPNLKDWKNGSLAFAGNAVTSAVELPPAAIDSLKSLFAGWTLPASISGAANADRKLTEVTLANGTKLQSYPGGIEDQLIKFIQSDEYKNGTADSLKEKWFSFDDLNFKFNSTELVPESKRQLDNIVAILKAYPDVKIKIGGYTDKKGNDAANKILSDDRAKAVKAALDKAGVAAQVPEAEGYGEEFAKVPETASDEERQADRKTSVRLLK